MTRRASGFDLALPATAKCSPAWLWLCDVLREQILSGQVQAGSRLPATRDLSRQYGLSRGTVVAAFEQLKAEGYLEGRVGSGTYVSPIPPEALLHVARSQGTAGAAANPRPGRLATYGRHVKLFSGYETGPTRAFRPNLPALDLFPTELWTQITSRFLRSAPVGAFMGCDALGYLPLRKAVAEYLAAARGVRCSVDQVVIMSGVQESLDLTARLLLDPGDRVCVEDPGYPGAVRVFEACGAKIVTAPVDEEGIEVHRLPRRDVRLVYVTPGHQFPLGTTMSLKRRLELLQWAKQSGALIFEDDYDSEYRYTGRPVPALQGLDPASTVIYAGTFSKVLFPALRLGYMVVPASLIDRVEAIKSITTRHAPVLEQAVLHEFIAEGHFGRHVRRMRTIYAERLALLMAETEQQLSGLLTMIGVEAGLQIAGWLAPGIDGEAAAAAAARRNVEVTPISRYARRELPRQGLQLGFAAVRDREIKRGVESLARALVSLSRHS